MISDIQAYTVGSVRLLNLNEPEVLCVCGHGEGAEDV